MDKKELSDTGREVTRAERILAVALALFLLIGGMRLAWIINSAFPLPDYSSLRSQFIPEALEREMNNLWQQNNNKLSALQRLQDEERELRQEYETAREEYRTLLDRGIDDKQKMARWEKARDEHRNSQAALSGTQAALRDFQNNILSPRESAFREAEARFQERFAQLNSQRNRRAGVALITYALAVFALAIWVSGLFRTRPLLSRYAVIGTSFLGFGAVQTLVVTYQVAYPFLRDLIPVEWVVSLGGSGLSIAGIVFLKNRLLSDEAVRNRRLWKKSCPLCGFPLPGNFCGRCGAVQQEKCCACGLLTSRFLPWCRECGSRLADCSEHS
ncbi:MAG: hypothetical protein DDT29_01350 [Dehalococcoidia bacterium]|nr:hypothetical protein [Bacillota bacterium]